METRKVYQRSPSERGMPLADGLDRYSVEIMSPIVSGGDVLGTVIFFSEGNEPTSDIECKLAQTVAQFLAHQMDA